jgi:pyruvate dehydrogenase E2 component (dihydrolipoamide acetyltransferase)
MADFLMPSLGADMETGKVVQWLVQPGSRVKRGDVVAVVETHKGAIDVEIFLDGVIDDLVPVGQELKVGAVLAHVREAGEAAPSTVAVTAARAMVSPAARRRARELGIDPGLLRGTGSDGAVTLADVEKAGSAAPSAPAVAATPPAQAPSAPAPAAPAAPQRPRTGFDAALMRQAIARAMARSKREIPHYYLTTTIDFAAASGWLESYNRDRAPEERLLPAALLLKATARALAEVPQLNGFYEKDAFRAGPGIHIGWAIALRGGGLVAPAIHDVDRKALPELMAALRDLVQRARAGGMRSSELTDPTVTVTSVGDRGAECVLGVIYPPQLAIIGFGRVVERPWVIQGQVQARRVVVASLAADHRASDGHVGGLLLAAIDRALQKPESL